MSDCFYMIQWCNLCVWYYTLEIGNIISYFLGYVIIYSPRSEQISPIEKQCASSENVTNDRREMHSRQEWNNRKRRENAIDHQGVLVVLFWLWLYSMKRWYWLRSWSVVCAVIHTDVMLWRRFSYYCTESTGHQFAVSFVVELDNILGKQSSYRWC